jgi:uncharacterized repeat protein (TIGR01451 family)
MALYAADGSFNVTVVDGTTITGVYAPGGSMNVYLVDGTTLTGLYHPCGAYNVYVSDGDILGVIHPCGAMVMSQSPYVPGTVYATGLGPVLTLSATTIAEDAADNTVVGALDVLNPTGTYVFTIESGDDPDNKFAISGSNLIIDELLDYETATSHSVTITANPDVGDTIERTFTITVTNAIEAPVNTVAPVVSGDLDGTLSCTTGTWASPDAAAATYTYQWKDAADDSDLTGETANTLDVTAYDGLDVYCTVTATNSADSTDQDSNTVGPLVGGGVLIGSLVLTWDEDDTDSTPEFEVDLPLGNGAPTDIAEDDVLAFEYSLDGADDWSSYVDITVTAGHISGDPLSFAGATPLANGEYDFRVRAERTGGFTSPWATDDVTVDAVAATREFAIGGLEGAYINTAGSRQWMTIGGYMVES